MVGEVVVLAMFEDEDASLVEQVAFEDEPGYLGQFLESIRRVGKDEVELLMTALQEAEHVATDEQVALIAQLLEALSYEVGMVLSASTLTTRLQPRETSSSEMLPVPAKRSRATASSKSMYPCSTLKIFSLAKSVVGRALKVRGISKCLPLYCPVMMRILLLSVMLVDVWFE